MNAQVWRWYESRWGQTDMAVEFVAPVIDKQKALAYLTDAIDRVKDIHIHRVARDMKMLKKKNSQTVDGSY